MLNQNESNRSSFLELFGRYRTQTPNVTEKTNSRARKLRAVVGNDLCEDVCGFAEENPCWCLAMCCCGGCPNS